MAFLFKVEDIFTISGRGTVATGRIFEGEISSNDTVVLIHDKKIPLNSVVTGIESLNKEIKKAVSGDKVGILLCDIKKKDIEKGAIIVDNTSFIKAVQEIEKGIRLFKGITDPAKIKKIIYKSRLLEVYLKFLARIMQLESEQVKNVPKTKTAGSITFNADDAPIKELSKIERVKNNEVIVTDKSITFDPTNVPIKCNLLLIGKSGAGKSDFANYLFGIPNKFRAAPGDPVTSWEENFQNYFFFVPKRDHKKSAGSSSKMPRLLQFFAKLLKEKKASNKANTPVAKVIVYDTVGLEAKKNEEWKSRLDLFLQEKQVPSSFSSSSQFPPANEMIHVCFHVINGANARVEPNEMSIINDICQKYKLPVSVIITNCDAATESQLTAIEKEIKNYGLESIRVCSVSERTRGNEKRETFDKEDAIRKVLSASYEKVGKELSIIVYQQMIKFISELKVNFINKIDKSDISIFKINEMDTTFEKITGELEKILSKFNDPKDYLPPAYINYSNFIDAFDVDYQGRNIYEDSFEQIGMVLDEFDMEKLSFGRKMNKAIDKMENGNILQKIGGFFTMGSTALFIKSNLKKTVAEAFDDIISKLGSQLRKILNS